VKVCTKLSWLRRGISDPSSAYCITLPSNSPYNIYWRSQVVSLLMQFFHNSLTSCLSLSLKPNILRSTLFSNIISSNPLGVEKFPPPPLLLLLLLLLLTLVIVMLYSYSHSYALGVWKPQTFTVCLIYHYSNSMCITRFSNRLSNESLIIVYVGFDNDTETYKIR
jgi:hypothetical protein